MNLNSRATLATLAFITACGSASAQSSVTLFGVLDTAVSHYSNGPTHQTVLSNSNLFNSRLGFRGSEDLGGGLSASFWLEGALTPDDGNANGFNFMRRSTVSLGSAWGELRLGRDFTPTFWNEAVFDPFGAVGVGALVMSPARSSSTAAGRARWTSDFGANNPAYIRASNTVGYFLPPTLGGFYGQLQYALDEQVTPGNDQGRFMSGRFGYAKGPLNAALSIGKTTGSDPASAAAPDITTYNLGASYDLGFARLSGMYSREKYERAAVSNTGKGYMVGVNVPVGVGNIVAAYSRIEIDLPRTPTSDKMAVGYVHNLSKRTALYATYARLGNKGDALLSVAASLPGRPNTSSSGYDLGIRHAF
ncbi:porin [Variovorax saccharolyticus]|uniref:porin n=1 Tax=Variovorax saccharolyticus TaxID=3053516 RepID=UPI002574AEF2|nr:porin [Variovorax sp. J22R187]MDM0019111.1 porin [Variovorax sp. J22R187]